MMLNTLIITPSLAGMAQFCGELQQGEGDQVYTTTSQKQALERIKSQSPSLVIIDEKSGGLTAQELIIKIFQTDASIQVVVVSGREPEDFHDAYEGLGVLAHLPPNPANWSARDLLQRLGR